MNAIWEHESKPNIKFTPAKSHRQRFSSPVDPHPEVLRRAGEEAIEVVMRY